MNYSNLIIDNRNSRLDIFGGLNDSTVTPLTYKQRSTGTDVDTRLEEFVRARVFELFSPQLEVLTERLAQVESRINNLENRESRIIAIQNIHSKKISLKNPLFININKKEGGEIIVDCVDVDLYGIGETEQEAISDFSENLEDFFYLLKNEGVKNLGRPMISIWNFFREVIVENNATKGKTSRRHI